MGRCPQPLGAGAGGTAAPREPNGTHRKTAHRQVFTARSCSGPPASSLLPPSRCPQHLSTEIVPRLKLESTNRSLRGCGMQAGGKDRCCLQDWGQQHRGTGTGRSPEGSHRKAEDRQKHPPGHHHAPGREGQGKDGTESWDLGSGAIRAAGQGSLDRNRSGLRSGIHLELKGNKRRTVKDPGQSYF